MTAVTGFCQIVASKTGLDSEDDKTILHVANSKYNNEAFNVVYFLIMKASMCPHVNWYFFGAEQQYCVAQWPSG